MTWRRTDPVQEVGALLAVGPGAAARVATEMAGRPAVLRALEVARGDDWIVVFAGALSDPTAAGETVLPRLAGAIPLYEESPGWWLPVGVEMTAPTHVHAALRKAMARDNDFDAPVVVVPRLDGADAEAADVYPVGRRTPLATSAEADT